MSGLGERRHYLERVLERTVVHDGRWVRVSSDQDLATEHTVTIERVKRNDDTCELRATLPDTGADRWTILGLGWTERRPPAGHGEARPEGFQRRWTLPPASVHDVARDVNETLAFYDARGPDGLTHAVVAGEPLADRVVGDLFIGVGIIAILIVAGLVACLFASAGGVGLFIALLLRDAMPAPDAVFTAAQRLIFVMAIPIGALGLAASWPLGRILHLQRGADPVSRWFWRGAEGYEHDWAVVFRVLFGCVVALGWGFAAGLFEGSP